MGLVAPNMWNLPQPGIEPMSHALAGGLLITGLPGKSYDNNLLRPFSNFTLRSRRRVNLDLFLKLIPDTGHETNKQKNQQKTWLFISIYLSQKQQKKTLKKRDYKTKF